MPITLSDWFCMKDGRSSFIPRLPDDARLVFCHGQLIQHDILSSIQQCFATDDPIKMLIHGDWGVGKTHLTYHIRWWLAQNRADYPAEPVIIEIGDITKKSRFDAIVGPLLDKLGLAFLIQLVHDYRGIEPNVAHGLKAAGVSAHVADAFNKILLSTPGQAPVELVTQTFEYLKGRKLGAGGAGLGAPLEQSQDFFDVLHSLGVMFKRVHARRLVFVADEAARLDYVSADDATESHWINANKLVLDDNNRSFGFIYTVSGKQQRNLPKAIWDPQLQNRLDKKVFALETLGMSDVDTYMTSLINEFVDRGRVEALVAAGAISPGEYDAAAYPFTLSARAGFIDYFNRTQENSKPRDISKRLDALAFIAAKLNSRLINDECLRRLEM